MRNQLIEANLHLVHAAVEDYCKCGVEMEDLYQAGYVGLITGVDKYLRLPNVRLQALLTESIREELQECVRSYTCPCVSPLLHCHEWISISS